MIKKLTFRNLSVKLLPFLLVFLVSCSNLPAEDDCLPALFPVAHPSGPAKRLESPENVVPKNWIPMFSPQQVESLNLSWANRPSMVVKSSNEIWFTAYFQDEQDYPQLVRYLVQSKALSTYQVEYKSDVYKSDVFGDVLALTTYVPDTVFLSKTGEVWGINFYRDDHFLSRYDAAADRFFPFAGNSQIPDERIGIDSDQNGNLWTIIKDSKNIPPSLMKVDVQQEQVTLIEIDKLDGLEIQYFAIDKQDRVWLYASSDFFEKYEAPPSKILRYDPSTNEFYDYGFGNFHDYWGNGLFVTRDNLLWIGNIGWLDTSVNDTIARERWNPVFWEESPLAKEYKNAWYRVMRPPLFLVDYGNPFGGGSFVLENYAPMIEDQRGRLWFGHPAVIVLDIQRGEWCQLNRAKALIGQDEKGTVWIFSENQLYQYSP